jgi:hypothetical protein
VKRLALSLISFRLMAINFLQTAETEEQQEIFYVQLVWYGGSEWGLVGEVKQHTFSGCVAKASRRWRSRMCGGEKSIK